MRLGTPQTLRARFTAIGVAVAAVAIGVLTIAFNLTLQVNADSDAKSRLQSLAAAAADGVTVRGGHVLARASVADENADRQVWLYEAERAVRRPVASAQLQRSADALAGEDRVFAEVPGRKYLLYALPVRAAGGRQVGTVVAGLVTDAYDRTTDLAMAGSFVLAMVLLASVAWLLWVVVGRALSPVREMTRTAGDWSAQGDPQRFGATARPAELAELASTFDDLLDRVAASLRHEQRLSAELSHELRTPLARITAEVELLARRDRPLEDRTEAYASIGRSAQQMSEILETLMAAARADAGLERGRCEVGAVFAGLRAGWPAEGARSSSGSSRRCWTTRGATPAAGSSCGRGRPTGASW
jgi:signal transduction histidine kinase